MNKDEILQSIKDGYKEFSFGRTKEAAGIWLPTWKTAKNLLMQGNYKTEKEILDLFGDVFLNWFFDLDIALMESDMHSERLDFNSYVLTIHGYLDQDNPRMNVAESLAALNRYEEAESMLSKWLEEDPLWSGGWTCWANILLDNDQKSKAREIIERGMTAVESSTESTDLRLFYMNAETIYRRLGEIPRAQYCVKKSRESASKMKQSPITGSVKIGRNDSCPCGSGKKYKKCCGN